MKSCPSCQKKYNDHELNFCLDCGGTLAQTEDSLPPTVMLKSPRETDPNWHEQRTAQFQSFGNPTENNDPFKQGGNIGWTPPPAPIQGWQNQPLGANTPFQPPMVRMVGQDQTLPIVSLVLGIIAISMFCCYGFGLPFGIAALITGYLGMNNTNNNPNRYGGHGLAIAGLVTGGIGTLIALFWILLFVFAGLSK